MSQQFNLSYDDVLLKPQYSDIRSRSEIDTSTDLGNGVDLSLPIFASPMDTVSEAAMAKALGACGGSAIIHRYNTIEEMTPMVTKNSNLKPNQKHKPKPIETTKNQRPTRNQQQPTHSILKFITKFNNMDPKPPPPPNKPTPTPPPPRSACMRR